MVHLGTSYADGLTRPMDLFKAEQWLRKAAKSDSEFVRKEAEKELVRFGLKP